VAYCESRFDPAAVSPDGANFGVMQVNKIHAAKVGGDLALLLEPKINLEVAHQIWLDQGWKPWSCKPY
jgi:soluble lytic murein transglycosylase-like protein